MMPEVGTTKANSPLQEVLDLAQDVRDTSDKIAGDISAMVDEAVGAAPEVASEGPPIEKCNFDGSLAGINACLITIRRNMRRMGQEVRRI